MLGFPIRTSPDHSLVGDSPGLNAASHVLHRLLMPRHPPCALKNLATKMLASTMQISNNKQRPHQTRHQTPRDKKFSPSRCDRRPVPHEAKQTPTPNPGQAPRPPPTGSSPEPWSVSSGPNSVFNQPRPRGSPVPPPDHPVKDDQAVLAVPANRPG